MKKSLLICMACFGFWSLHASAQSAGPSVIASASGGGVVGVESFDYTVGEMVVSTITAPNIILTQGLLQPEPPLTNIGAMMPENKAIKVYPNPASEVVMIQPLFSTQSEVLVVVYDVLGRKLLESSFTHKARGDMHQLNVGGLAAGTYKLIVDVVAPIENASYTFNIQVVK